jgi:membrane-associated phospholipid phosphatase
VGPFRSSFVVLSLLALAALPLTSNAANREGFCGDTWSGFAPPGGGVGPTLLHRSNLFHGVLWLGTGLGIRAGADPSSLWEGTNSFDRGVRDGLVASSRSGRDDAATGSDVLLGLTVLWPLFVDAGVLNVNPFTRELRDCDRALEISSDWLESMGFALMLTEATKVIAGRERPFGLGCDGYSGYSSDCDGGSRFKSFFSGHSSLSATGAALMCKNAIRREVWGPGRGVKALVCGLGAGAAVGTGVLRMVADKHWMTDVLTGWAIGGLVGWFDTWGPFDLLRFEYEANGRTIEAAWTPVATPEHYGVALSMRF